MSRIVITGMGVISAVGNTVAENRMALINGKSGMSAAENFSSKYASLLPFGEIKTTDNQLRDKLNCHDKALTRTTLIALHAFNEAVADSGISTQQMANASTALIGASTVGGMCHTNELYQDAQLKGYTSPYLSSYDSATTFLWLQQQHQMNGIINTINTACSSSANAIMYGARLIKHGLAKRAIVGGVDSLAKFTINGFNALHILSPNLCTPFDEGRTGLNLGEGAAFLVLEKEEDVAGKKVYAAVSGYYNSNDAYHSSSLSQNGDGPLLAMNGALKSAGLNPQNINFINAHGTGTENNDLVESRAMLHLFKQVPNFASTKANVGHTLGAASAIEAVYSILNLFNQEIYPSLRCSNPIAETGLIPVNKYIKIPLHHVMSNSFGFGGNCASLIFSKV